MSDTILYWNNIALDAVALDHSHKEVINADGTNSVIKATQEQGGPTKTARALAIIHLAMFDAFNGIKELYEPYLKPVLQSVPGSSVEAAITAAAFTALNALYGKDKDQTDRFKTAYQTYLGALSDSSTSINDGLSYGRDVANRLLLKRMNDGSRNTVIYVPRQSAGFHRPDPYHPNQGFLDPHWGTVVPFCINDITAFRAKKPPALNSQDYADSFNEVKSFGAINSTTRTPRQTAIGLYWGYDGANKLGTPPRLYNQIARVIAVNQKNTLEKNVRLFALLNTALADAGIQCWESKYFYNVWRPIVGIREADKGWGPTGKGDDNPDTDGDPFWQPLGAPKTNPNLLAADTPLTDVVTAQINFTPGFPAYPSGHATFGAAAFDIIKHFYNGDDNISFEFVSDELDGKSLDVGGSLRTRYLGKYKTLTEAKEDNAKSRVFLGVHWQFDANEGIESGEAIAKHIFDNCLKEKIPQA